MVKGSCVCGSITFNTSADPVVNMECYCLDCRKNSGHLGQVISKFNTLEVTIDDPKRVLKTYVINKTQSGKPKHKVFCSECGCTIATLPQTYNGEITMLRTTLLDEFPQSYAPTKRLFEDEKAAYANGVSM